MDAAIIGNKYGLVIVSALKVFELFMPASHHGLGIEPEGNMVDALVAPLSILASLSIITVCAFTIYGHYKIYKEHRATRRALKEEWKSRGSIQNEKERYGIK